MVWRDNAFSVVAFFTVTQHGRRVWRLNTGIHGEQNSAVPRGT